MENLVGEGLLHVFEEVAVVAADGVEPTAHAAGVEGGALVEGGVWVAVYAWEAEIRGHVWVYTLAMAVLAWSLKLAVALSAVGVEDAIGKLSAGNM